MESSALRAWKLLLRTKIAVGNLGHEARHGRAAAAPVPTTGLPDSGTPHTTLCGELEGIREGGSLATR